MRYWWWPWLLLATGCASAPLPPPLPVVPPPPPRAIVVIGLGASGTSEVCVERPWIGGEAQYDCVTVTELRAMVLHRLSAE